MGIVDLLFVSAACGCHGWPISNVDHKLRKSSERRFNLVDDNSDWQPPYEIDKEPVISLARLLLALKPVAAFSLSGSGGRLSAKSLLASRESLVRYSTAALQEETEKQPPTEQQAPAAFDLFSLVSGEQPSMFWPINSDFPGLEKVVDEPRIFVIDDLLSKEQCEALIAKAKPRLKESRVQTAEGLQKSKQRTSTEATMAFEEVPGIQQKISELLNMSLLHFEPLKVSRYEEGQEFKPHYDCQPMGAENGTEYCQTPYCNRVVSLSIYLTDNEEGGATSFPLVGLTIQPTRGMGVLYFPAYMPINSGKLDDRLMYSEDPANETKYVCQQWAWTGPLDREKIKRVMFSELEVDSVVL